MALTKVSTDGVKDDAITKSKIPANQIEASELADNAVDTNSIATQAVTNAKLGDNAVTGAKISNGAVVAGKIGSGAVGVNEIADNAVSASKLASGVQTTVNNNANNKVITGSDTANTLEAEANLTFDGGGQLSIAHTDPKIALVDTTNNTDSYIFTDDNGSLRLQADQNSEAPDTRVRIQTDGTERVSIDSNLKILDGDLIIGTDGHGIDFSAQTTAGSNYTKDSELLDHYEEGTFTPSVSSPQLNSNQLPAFTDGSYSKRHGNYIKIGRLVMFVVTIVMNSSRTFANGDGTQVNAITGCFPFARSTSSEPRHSPCSIRFNGSTYTDDRIYADARNDFNPPNVRVTKCSNNGVNTLSINDAFPNSGTVSISGFYLADA